MEELYKALRAHHNEHFSCGGKRYHVRLIVFLRPSLFYAFSLSLSVRSLLFPLVKILRRFRECLLPHLGYEVLVVVSGILSASLRIAHFSLLPGFRIAEHYFRYQLFCLYSSFHIT